jgi:hypothetical protein
MQESKYNLGILQCQLDSNICTHSCTSNPHAIMAWTDNLTSHITIRQVYTTPVDKRVP